MVTKHPLWWYASYQYISKGYIVCHYSCLSVRPWWLQCRKASTTMFLRQFALMNCILYVQCMVLLPTNNIRWSKVVMLKALHRWREGGSKHYTEGEGDRGFRNPGIVLMYSLPLAYIQWFKNCQSVFIIVTFWDKNFNKYNFITSRLGNNPALITSSKNIWATHLTKVPRVGLRRG